MLFIMGLLYVRTMRQRGFALIAVSPASYWVQQLVGDYTLVDTDTATGEPRSSARLAAWLLPDSMVTLDARYTLAFRMTAAEKDGHSPLEGVLGINDFEDRQILVEWYDRGGRNRKNGGLLRQDGCEILLANDTLGFWGTTLGEFCFPFQQAENYGQLKVMGTREQLSLRVERYATWNDSLLGTNIYRLKKES